MKNFKFFIIGSVALLTSCASSNNVINDDAYYSPYDNNGNSNKELVVSNDGSFSTNKISSNSQYDYQSYYSEEASNVKSEPIYEKTESVTDTNGVVYTTTEVYYDEDYANRIKKFGTQSGSNTSYYDYDDDYYYDDNNVDIYLGVGYP